MTEELFDVHNLRLAVFLLWKISNVLEKTREVTAYLERTQLLCLSLPPLPLFSRPGMLLLLPRHLSFLSAVIADEQDDDGDGCCVEVQRSGCSEKVTHFDESAWDLRVGGMGWV